MMEKIGILTSGGDAPGMNAAVASIARAAKAEGMELVGIKRGYRGLMPQDSASGDAMEVLDLETILDIEGQPGTFLRTARFPEFKEAEVRQKAVQNLRAQGVGGLVVIGGDGSFQGALRLCELGVPCIGIPGTIDNDLAYTERTLGYDTAVNVCVDAVRMIRATSRSHDRAGVVEVMGRDCGDIALMTAMATNAEMVIVPEVRWNVRELADRLISLREKKNLRTTLIVAEGVFLEDNHDPFDWYDYLKENDPKNIHKYCPTMPMNAAILAGVLRAMVPGCEARATVLGYIQRGAAPMAYDAAYAFEAGHLAVSLLKKGTSEQVIGVKRGKVFNMPIREALAMQRPFNYEMYRLINRDITTIADGAL